MSARSQILKGTYTLTGEVDWETAYKEYLPRVYNFFRYRVGDASLSEDLTADVFEKAWRGRARFRRDLGAFSTWLFTIARNAATDHFRRNGRDVLLEAVRELQDPTSLEEIAQREHDFAKLNTLLSQLPAREHELIALKYSAELNNC